MKLVFGEKKVTRPAVHRDDADDIRGPAWRARRAESRYIGMSDLVVIGSWSDVQNDPYRQV